MDKAQALHHFWSSFGIPAYDENTLPTGDDIPSPPYITYAVAEGALGGVILLSASVWYRSTSWVAISQKVAEIGDYLASGGYHIEKLDHGYLWMVQGTPFAQRMSDPEDDMLRRYYLNVKAEYLTAT